MTVHTKKCVITISCTATRTPGARKTEFLVILLEPFAIRIYTLSHIIPVLSVKLRQSWPTRILFRPVQGSK